MGKPHLIRAAGKAAIAAASFLLTAASPEQKLQRLLAMTPDQFAAKVHVSDDELEKVAVLDTEAAWRDPPSDNFLRAMIDKATGKVTIELYQTVAYRGEWRFYDTINYFTPTGIETAPLIKVDTSVDCTSASYDGGACAHTEDVAFIIPSSLVGQVASIYRPGGNAAWKFKVKGRIEGADWPDGVVPAEFVGLLKAVNTYKTAQGIK